MFITGNTELDRALLSVLSALLIAWILYKLRAKANVRWFVFHAFTFVVPAKEQQSPFTVQIGTTRVENWGREKATNVQIFHAVPPQLFKIWPAVDYFSNVTSEGYHVITVKTLAPGEAFSIELLSSHQSLPTLVRVRSDEGDAKEGRFAVNRYVPKAVQYIFAGLAIVGVSVIIYLIFLLIAAIGK